MELAPDFILHYMYIDVLILHCIGLVYFGFTLQLTIFQLYM